MTPRRGNGHGRDVAPHGSSKGAEVVEPAVSDIARVLRLVELEQVVAFIPRSVANRYPRKASSISEWTT